MPKQSQQGNPFDEQRRDINIIKGMFRGQPDLTESVISTVYQQNKGDVERTAETLLDIGSDVDAVNQIRQNSNQKKPVVVEHPRQPNQPVGPKPVPVQEPPKWPAVPPKQHHVPQMPAAVDPEEEEKRLRMQKIEELRLKKKQQALLVEKEKQLAQLLAKQEAEEQTRLESLRKQKEEAERLEREQREREEMDLKLEEMRLDNERRIQEAKRQEEEKKKEETAQKAKDEAERQEKEKANRLALEERIRQEQEEQRKMEEAERTKLVKDLNLQVVEQGSSAGDDEDEGEDLENSRLNKEEQDKRK